jgi:hypothetical protein
MSSNWMWSYNSYDWLQTTGGTRREWLGIQESLTSGSDNLSPRFVFKWKHNEFPCMYVLVHAIPLQSGRCRVSLIQFQTVFFIILINAPACRGVRGSRSGMSLSCRCPGPDDGAAPGQARARDKLPESRVWSGIITPHRSMSVR